MVAPFVQAGAGVLRRRFPPRNLASGRALASRAAPRVAPPSWRFRRSVLDPEPKTAPGHSCERPGAVQKAPPDGSGYRTYGIQAIRGLVGYASEKGSRSEPDFLLRLFDTLENLLLVPILVEKHLPDLDPLLGQDRPPSLTG